jgi:hypothetical protein
MPQPTRVPVGTPFTVHDVPCATTKDLYVTVKPSGGHADGYYADFVGESPLGGRVAPGPACTTSEAAVEALLMRTVVDAMREGQSVFHFARAEESTLRLVAPPREPEPFVQGK